MMASEIAKVIEAPILPPPAIVPAVEAKARSASGRARLWRAAQILVLLEALASALCLPPPGLGSVLSQTLPDGVTTYAAPRIAAFDARPLIPADAAGKPGAGVLSSGCERRRTAPG
ncbi:hypothetical protein [Polyangium spumosum]|uniref:hypothetical protein n=1 Tax=Polyangium spumosum TaxID=889282 RepID=UPI0014790E63|nr:hypothetical protein [Polyangium spumosum]